MRLSFSTPTIGMKWAYAESKKQIVNRIRKPRGYSADRTAGWGGEILTIVHRAIFSIAGDWKTTELEAEV